MPLIREEAVDRMHRDHEVLIELITRIQATCVQGRQVASCDHCQLNQRQVCHGNIEQLIKGFVEATLKHNLVESLLMQDNVPKAHRLAHNRAHLAIAEELKSIRLVLSEDGNCVLAIAGIERVLDLLRAHFTDYDQQLEAYLLTAA